MVSIRAVTSIWACGQSGQEFSTDTRTGRSQASGVERAGARVGRGRRTRHPRFASLFRRDRATDAATPSMASDSAVTLVEQWLLFEETACYLLTDWLIAASRDPGPEPSATDVINELGTLGVKLHHILRAGVPDTGHRHPPNQ